MKKKTKMSKITKVNLIILSILFIFSMIPLIMTFMTAVIPEGDLFNITKEKTLLDFELSKFFLKTKMKTIGTFDYDIFEENDKKFITVDIKEKNTGISSFARDLDINYLRHFELEINPNKKLNNILIGLKDIDGKYQIVSYKINTKPNEWQKVKLELNPEDFGEVDTKHTAEIQVLFDEEIKVSMDNVILKYKFPTFMNFKTVWEENDFGRYMLNSTIISISVVLGNLIFCSLVAYPFARKDFKGKEILFMIVLATYMIPPQIKVIPIFILMQKLNWIDTYQALIMPTLVTPFGIFLMRQYFEQLPRELDQAAYVDGANDFQIFTKVIMPLSGPALAVLGINSFIASWNDLYMPLVLTTSKEMRTVQVGLAMFQKINGVKWPLIMAASAIVGIPVIIAFLFFQKKIIAGITDGALKG
ncbi:carbohydrate ABC transporter permease [Oceanotoga teriensis]|uniref:carbohydrate ABC transporter permease n=1 Tax=Oceanotoga teriensis TaxID=515440 RepID=UPI002713D072|nr:ABC transporter permease subunit [Oceanotoga teriensis]MDO7975954.1 ABC transporter permease subunit [Oceanotoga teriensis]